MDNYMYWSYVYWFERTPFSYALSTLSTFVLHSYRHRFSIHVYMYRCAINAGSYHYHICLSFTQHLKITLTSQYVWPWPHLLSFSVCSVAQRTLRMQQTWLMWRWWQELVSLCLYSSCSLCTSPSSSKRLGYTYVSKVSDSIRALFGSVWHP